MERKEMFIYIFDGFYKTLPLNYNISSEFYLYKKYETKERFQLL